jgi:hypothetical protein
MESARSYESLFSDMEMEEEVILLGQPLPADEDVEEMEVEIASSQETVVYWSQSMEAEPEVEVIEITSDDMMEN